MTPQVFQSWAIGLFPEFEDLWQAFFVFPPSGLELKSPLCSSVKCSFKKCLPVQCKLLLISEGTSLMYLICFT